MVVSHNTAYDDRGGTELGCNFTTLGIFLAPDYVVDSFFPLIDLRGHRLDNDLYAFDVGIGGRYILQRNCFCEMMGINLFYDWRQGYLHEYNQLGVGFEILGRRWDFRANGYLPVGQKRYSVKYIYDQYVGGYVITERRHEVTTYGFNAEVGWLAFCRNGFMLYAAAGPYYLTRKSFFFEPIIGGEIRIRPQYRDYFAVDVRFSHDSKYKTIWDTTFIVSLPLYQMSHQNECPCHLTDRQIYQPIERLELMTLGYRSCWTQNY